MSTQLKNEVGSIAEAIMYFVRHYTRSDKTFSMWFSRLQHCLADFEYPNLAVKDCLDLKADFDLIIRDGDSQQYATLKIIRDKLFPNPDSAHKSLIRENKRQKQSFKKYSDIDSTFVLLYKSNKRISFEGDIPFNDENCRIVLHQKPMSHTYLWEEPQWMDDANDTLYNRGMLGNIWSSNLYGVVRKK